MEAYFPSLPAHRPRPRPAPAGAPAHGASPRARELPHFDESDDELLYLLLTEGLRRALASWARCCSSERLRAVRVRESPQVQASRPTAYGGLLDLAVGRERHDRPPTWPPTWTPTGASRSYLRLSNGDILRLDGSVRALDNLADGLGVDAAGAGRAA